MIRLTPILSALLRPLEDGDGDASGTAALVGIIAGDFVDDAGVDEEEEPVEEGEGDDKDDDDDDAIIIGLEAAAGKLIVDGPQVCGGTALFDVILKSGV